MLNVSFDVAEGSKFKYGNLLKDYKSLENSENKLQIEYSSNT